MLARRLCGVVESLDEKTALEVIRALQGRAGDRSGIAHNTGFRRQLTERLEQSQIRMAADGR